MFLTYNQKFLELTEDINNGNTTNLSIHFNEFLDIIVGTNTIICNNMDSVSRHNTYKFFENIPIVLCPVLLNLLNLKRAVVIDLRILDFFAFLESEILYRIDKLGAENRILELKNTFPLNPELLNSLANIKRERKDFLTVYNLRKTVLDLVPNEEDFVSSKFSSSTDYVNDLLKNDNYEMAEEFVNNILASREYVRNNHIIFHNVMMSYIDRIEDHKMWMEKYSIMQNNISTQIKNDVEQEKIKVIEVLGFFSAIVAFILSTVSIGKNFNFVENVIFLILLGFILILFTTSLSILFKKQNKLQIGKHEAILLIITLFIFIGLSIVIFKVGFVSIVVSLAT